MHVKSYASGSLAIVLSIMGAVYRDLCGHRVKRWCMGPQFKHSRSPATDPNTLLLAIVRQTLKVKNSYSRQTFEHIDATIAHTYECESKRLLLPIYVRRGKGYHRCISPFDINGVHLNDPQWLQCRRQLGFAADHWHAGTVKSPAAIHPLKRGRHEAI
ncbi:hypothetical protein F4776DRAFT_425980 [Hypoxylon sp. NC0597]|nr:hypothetical protein F4776DRAFT_425980 [Hypoxylon sp. NC0597]